MRILALTRYERLGSSSRVRFYQYFPYLHAQGIEITSIPFFRDAYVQNLYAGRRANSISVLNAYIKRLIALFSSSKFDLLWIEKELFPWLPAWFEIFLHKLGFPYVVDYDDAVFHRYDMHKTGLVRGLLGRKIDQVMRHSALVIVGNEYLADKAKQAGASRVEYLPSVVDVNRYQLKQPQKVSTFRVGWIGSPLTAKYLSLVDDVVQELANESDIQMVLLGIGPNSPFKGVPTEVLAWNEEIELILSQKMDVGIMPLIDEPFERGKCGYKLIQYMAGGIPVVASPIGVNRHIVEHQVNGYLAASKEDWLFALRSLRDNLEKRAAMGWAAHRKAEKLYNLQVTAPVLYHLLMSVIRNKKT